ncbi:hypothetical protein ACYJW8_06110 [Frateuria aurantia]
MGTSLTAATPSRLQSTIDLDEALQLTEALGEKLRGLAMLTRGARAPDGGRDLLGELYRANLHLQSALLRRR